MEDQLQKLVKNFIPSNSNEKNKIQKPLAEICSKVKNRVTKEKDEFLTADSQEMVGFLAQIIDVFLSSKKVRRLSQLMNIESSNISIEKRLENLSVLNRPDDSSRFESSRSHFTSIDGPPKVYEDIMRQLEADVRKHIRIEH